MKGFIILFLVVVLSLSLVYAETTPSSSGCVDLASNIRQGSRDNSSKTEVYSLQAFLNAKGYLKVAPTGFFGVQTLRAVKNLQKENAVTPTGFVGPLTRALIKKISCVVSVPEPVPEQPAPVSNPPIVPTPVVADEILTAPNNSSLRVRTDGVVSTTKDSVLVRGSITSGARSGTERWFEITENPDLYKVSETTVSPKLLQRSNGRFEQLFTGLKPSTGYYFRVCASNVSLGQKSCGGTIYLVTSQNQ